MEAKWSLDALREATAFAEQFLRPDGIMRAYSEVSDADDPRLNALRLAVKNSGMTPCLLGAEEAGRPSDTPAASVTTYEHRRLFPRALRKGRRKVWVNVACHAYAIALMQSAMTEAA
ncbi:hypothetical protein [Ruegeria arenilitoris]|uniref:hypothetical protein n=1 Tax=Ruegeria arenilitoris TaxID=1173585 RepID=UPI00147C87BB|nr:hypothetical protein [Ruegeria arenilitoris]